MKYKSDEEFLRELLKDFRIEAAEHLQAIVDGLLKLEQKPGPETADELVESVFREVHSMKGAARAVNLGLIEQLCMSLEDVFHEIKNKKLLLQSHMFSLFFSINDTLQCMVEEIDSPNKSVNQKEITKLITELEALIREEPKKSGISFFQAGVPDEEKEHRERSTATDTSQTSTERQADPGKAREDEARPAASAETVRVSVKKLELLLRQAEEVIPIKTAIDYQLRQLDDLASSEDEGLLRLADSLKQENKILALSINDLMLGIRQTLMCPFSSLLNIVPRIIRDLGKEYKKEIQYEVAGGEIEIDRRILEEMKDPLIHLIRNCIDHGIESREERLKHMKPAAGLVKISVSLDSDQKVVIRISDDGRGINSGQLVNAALKSGAIVASDSKDMTEDEKLMLLFKSGVSTSPFITDVSGRGLGMAIVDEKVSKIGGSIFIQTAFGKGTTFTITLPQTIAAFRGLLVKVADQQFLIQTTAIIKVLTLRPDDIKSVESKKTLLYQGENLALVSLADVLGIEDRRSRAMHGYAKVVLITEVSHRKVAFVADEVLGEQEGIVKSLGSHLKHVRNIAGASLLGDGKLVPVLHLPELTESALLHGETAEYTPDNVADDPMRQEEEVSVLVVEDSITVRNVLKNIIETSGFRVTTAVDGMEAYAKMQEEDFNLVVSDVDMPRMNGFELTSKIRNSKQLADIPVVLVTALESAEDRKKGLEAGANAYIRKGSFDKGNLIETIKRLI